MRVRRIGRKNAGEAASLHHSSPGSGSALRSPSTGVFFRNPNAKICRGRCPGSPVYSLGVMRALALALYLLVACDKKERRWDTVATATTASTGVAKVETGSLNTAFPPDGALGYKRIFTADKEGYAEAKLQKDGEDVATLAISQADEAAKTKFKSAATQLKGHPLVTVGKNQSAVLVANRFQLKVSSTTLDEPARRTVLEAFAFDRLPTKEGERR
jgi:hypothetical protein